MKSLYESILSSTGTGSSFFGEDLGLSVRWCSCNIGATKPEEYGLYFAWGDTNGYKESEVKEYMFTQDWYSKLPASKIKSNLKLKDDAANKYLGGFRIPTSKEFKELKENTKQTIEVLNGIRGMRFTAKNGNSIFIPFAGYSFNGPVKATGYSFYCWSSSFGNEKKSHSFSGSGGYGTFEDSFSRCSGFSVRAVCDK